MSDLVENDISFALLSHHVPEIFHFMFSSGGGGGHFEHRALAEQFVICYVYGDANSMTLRDARAVKWRAKKKKSTIQLVPDSDSLRLHLDRTNYLAYLLKHNHLQSHPSSIGHRWQLVNGLRVLICSTAWQHGEHRALAELAVTFERYIGDKFSVKLFRLSNQSRKKGRKRMVTESTKMTLL